MSATTVLHVLPLLHHAQRLIVEVNDFKATVLQAGGQLLHVHHEGALTCHTGNYRLGLPFARP